MRAFTATAFFVDPTDQSIAVPPFAIEVIAAMKRNREYSPEPPPGRPLFSHARSLELALDAVILYRDIIELRSTLENVNVEAGIDTGGIYGLALCKVLHSGWSPVQKLIEVASLLLDRGANVNVVAGRYGTALTSAAYRGYEEIVLLLLNRGADVNLVGSQYGTALTAAASRGYEEQMSTLWVAIAGRR